MNSQGCTNTTIDDDIPLSWYKEEPYEEDMFQEEKEWKKKEERYATIKFRSNLVPRVTPRSVFIKVKKYKQKFRLNERK
jgi:hypothetical protein